MSSSPSPRNLPATLGDLRKSDSCESRVRDRRVKCGLRDNLKTRLRDRKAIIPGVIGFDDTVVAQIVNAVLSRHKIILVGLRGQAKSRILRALPTFLDAQAPFVGG